MRYYVMGLDDDGKLTTMTRRHFDSMTEAQEYAQGCAKSREPFVVGTVTKPSTRGVPEEVWTTKDKQQIPVGLMHEGHVRNALRMLIRRRRHMQELLDTNPAKGRLIKFFIGEMLRKQADDEADVRFEEDLYNDVFGDDRKWGSD